MERADQFFNFKTIPPSMEGEAPIVAVPNVKVIVGAYLQQRFKGLKLRNPIEVYGDYVPIVNMHQRPTETERVDIPVKRFVSIVQLSSSVKLDAVGQVIRTRTIKELESAGFEDIGQYGWVETTQLEISYWSIDAKDRDQVSQLVKLFVFEMHRNGYLMKNGIPIMNFRTAFDTANERLPINQVIYGHVMHFDFVSIFFGTEKLQKEFTDFITAIDIEPQPTNPGDDYQFVPQPFEAPGTDKNTTAPSGLAGGPGTDDKMKLSVAPTDGLGENDGNC